MVRSVSVIVALALMLMPADSLAQAPQTNAPPGNSAVDEYLETIPEASGNRSPGAGDDDATALTPAQRARLERLGPDGKALADMVDSTSPNARKPAQGPTGQGSSPLHVVFEAATGHDGGGGGMGWLLPAILIATVLGAVAVVVARRRPTS